MAKSNEEKIKLYAESQNKMDESNMTLPCPRCGRLVMRRGLVMNALSRHENIYICSGCGVDEAFRDMAGNKSCCACYNYHLFIY